MEVREKWREGKRGMDERREGKGRGGGKVVAA